MMQRDAPFDKYVFLALCSNTDDENIWNCALHAVEWFLMFCTGTGKKEGIPNTYKKANKEKTKRDKERKRKRVLRERRESKHQ